MKKLIPIVIAVSMLCVVFAAADTNVDADSEPYLWVGTTAIYGQDVEMPTWSFRSSTNTLTLNGLVLTGNEYHEYRDMHDEPASAAIYYCGGDALNVIVRGNSTIKSDSRYGISTDGNGGLNISGNGVLNVTNKNTYNNAVYVLCGDLTINGGVLNLENKPDHESDYDFGSVNVRFDSLIINNGILNCSEGIGTGDGNVAINGGCINIPGKDQGDVVVRAISDIVIDGSPYEMNVNYIHDPGFWDEIKAASDGDVIISYINERTVNFDANGGSCSTASKKTDVVGKIDSLPEATRDGYEFAGWYTAKEGGERVTDSARFFQDTTVYAIWVNSHFITFDAGEGKVDIPFEITDLDGKLRTIPEATRDGWRFGGWYTEPEGKGERVTKSTVFHDNATVYAFWDDTRVVRFNAQGGDVDIPFELTDKEGKLRMVPTTEREGYIFEGWYTEPYGGEKITADTVFHTDAMAYAHWKMDITMGCIAAGITAVLALVIVAVSILFVRKH